MIKKQFLGFGTKNPKSIKLRLNNLESYYVLLFPDDPKGNKRDKFYSYPPACLFKLIALLYRSSNNSTRPQ